MDSLHMTLAKVPAEFPFALKETQDKGIGAFAIRNITRGELVLSERPLLRIVGSRYLAADVQAQYDKLGDVQKAVYMSLASAHGQDASRYPSTSAPYLEKGDKRRIREQYEALTGEEKSVLSICMTNAMETDNGAAIFELASRFNHECVPNACFSWDEREGVERIHATRNIAKGEEITVCYCDPFYDVSMRRWELMHYGFECRCRACHDFDKAGTFANESRERRWKLRELGLALPLCQSEAERLRVRLQMVAATKAEGLQNPAVANMYLEIAQICDHTGDGEMAVKAARKALDMFTVCLGADSEDAQDAAKRVRVLEKQLRKRSEQK
ncbi:uncharacterized protein PV09_05263 [Verruconis gallopava]|uniref:SET domain-containing protein n=1 Tax=Verruconis gallopava TaxID=253628 RepID=A0A0D1XM56_9PEZI|nr:uncharacterized protein PV09_05263 [Verruconis gallopava]KIW03496.1 hypothetical protein PV09_05263 [Verruconis gallopava]